VIATAALPSLERPTAFLGRSDSGIRLDAGNDRANLLLVVFVPAGMEHVQGEIRDNVASLMESDYLRERLLQAETPTTMLDAVREGMQVALD
jgi:mannitol/fructose-specific phosphotransferase system IIA component (Ntr-type)